MIMKELTFPFIWVYFGIRYIYIYCIYIYNPPITIKQDWQWWYPCIFQFWTHLPLSGFVLGDASLVHMACAPRWGDGVRLGRRPWSIGWCFIIFRQRKDAMLMGERWYNTVINQDDMPLFFQLQLMVINLMMMMKAYRFPVVYHHFRSQNCHNNEINPRWMIHGMVTWKARLRRRRNLAFSDEDGGVHFFKAREALCSKYSSDQVIDLAIDLESISIASTASNGGFPRKHQMVDSHGAVSVDLDPTRPKNISRPWSGPPQRSDQQHSGHEKRTRCICCLSIHPKCF